MQNLKVGEIYTATLNNRYYRNERSILKYLGPHEEWEEVFRFEVMERKQWPHPLVDAHPDDTLEWGLGQTLDLGIDDYTFEPYNIVLENE